MQTQRRKRAAVNALSCKRRDPTDVDSHSGRTAFLESDINYNETAVSWRNGTAVLIEGDLRE